MVRRTKKEFKPYNDYVDRPFELKWPTAFPLGELTEAIKNTDEYHARNIERLPQQSQRQIEYFLDRSIKQNKVLEKYFTNHPILDHKRIFIKRLNTI